MAHISVHLSICPSGHLDICVDVHLQLSPWIIRLIFVCRILTLLQTFLLDSSFEQKKLFSLLKSLISTGIAKPHSLITAFEAFQIASFLWCVDLDISLSPREISTCHSLVLRPIKENHEASHTLKARIITYCLSSAIMISTYLIYYPPKMD